MLIDAGREPDLTVISVEGESELSALLVEFDVEAALVRPDHYLLGTANNLSELILLVDTATVFIQLPIGSRQAGLLPRIVGAGKTPFGIS